MRIECEDGSCVLYITHKPYTYLFYNMYIIIKHFFEYMSTILLLIVCTPATDKLGKTLTFSIRYIVHERC